MKRYELDYFQVSRSNGAAAASTVKVSFEDRVFENEAYGDGPVDAIFKAINGALGLDIKLVNYSAKAAVGEKDALGEVTVKLSRNGENYTGYEAGKDVVETSAKAYLSAVNRLVLRRDGLNNKCYRDMSWMYGCNYFGEGAYEKWAFELETELI